jgi:hypothetical protein
MQPDCLESLRCDAATADATDESGERAGGDE